MPCYTLVISFVSAVFISVTVRSRCPSHGCHGYMFQLGWLGLLVFFFNQPLNQVEFDMNDYIVIVACVKTIAKTLLPFNQKLLEENFY